MYIYKKMVEVVAMVKFRNIFKNKGSIRRVLLSLFFVLHTDYGYTFPEPLDEVEAAECFSAIPSYLELREKLNNYKKAEELRLKEKGLPVKSLLISEIIPKALTIEEQEIYKKCLKKRDKLINHNTRLVAHIAKKYRNIPSKEQEELIPTGIHGLVKAVDTIKLEREIKFSGYASKCIENEIRMFLRRFPKDIDYLDRPIGDDKDGNSTSLIDTIPDTQCDVAGDAELFLMAAVIEEIVNSLEKRDRAIIILRYGLYGYDVHTQNDIAKRFKISRSYVSRIETRVKKEIKRRLTDNNVNC
jgi:RNA polymerase sporulation-specific sigma factor